MEISLHISNYITQKGFQKGRKIIQTVLVRCPKLLFGKFNILEFKRGAEQGSQRTKNVSHQIYQF